ncbi:hypothetical protein [Staphylothermus hellenicus]|uniref:Uncharacterized protein n=1 Tax=Staphylothermus hellenicus (strain DSM 12710 / JCM 10830 / BK20S6-10-b1 / P8) TaxID=591019 RepID=D7D8I2_STAHD|nr:hypothetical protein [Staphylothermus hellenicus]ADI32078.1 hypothetical protein Shell_0972 [Staphylothermus hellenicus DSM 12710]
MKAQLPIVIAIVILGGLIIASLFYVTSITLYTRSLSKGTVKNDWDIIDQELDTLDLVALKYASTKAYKEFISSFDTIYNEISYTLSLEDRSAIYYSDFSTDDTSNLVFIADNHYVDTNRQVLVLESSNDFAIAIIDIPISGRFYDQAYVAYKGTADQHIDWFQIRIRRFLLFSYIRYMYILGNNIPSQTLEVIYYRNGAYRWWRQLSESVPAPYVYYGGYDYTSGILSLDVFDKINNVWANITYDRGSTTQRLYYGVGGYSHVEIDKLVLSVNRDPKYIYVEGLHPGWRVVVSDGTNSYEGVAGSSGEAKVFFPDLIFRNGVISVYDETGELLISKTFDVIVGGDRYVFRAGNLADYDYYQALDNFKQSLNNASLAALSVLKRSVLEVIYNWISCKTREGYSINITYFKPFYNITLWNNGYISNGRGSIGFEIKYFIIAPDGEYREFVKSINATYVMSFDSAYPYGFRNMTIPFKLGTFLIINGRKYSYMQPNTLLGIRIYSILFQILPSLRTISGGLDYVDLTPEKTLYLANGTMDAYYKLPYGYTSGIATIDLYYDIVDNLVPVYGNHMYFLWATISVANIDGVKVPSATKLVFIYNYYYRVMQVRIYGDENRPITPLT